MKQLLQQQPQRIKNDSRNTACNRCTDPYRLRHHCHLQNLGVTMKDEVKALLAILAVLAFVFLAMLAARNGGLKEGEAEGKKEIRRQAVLEGVGEYRINENGKLEFHWKKTR